MGPKTFFLSLGLTILVLLSSKAQTTYYSIASGNWGSTSVWSTTPGGPSCNCIPADNSTSNIVISAGHTVTLNASNWTIKGNLTIKSNAVLDLQKTLDLGTSSGCGYTVTLEQNSQIVSTGNSNGQKLKICNQAILSEGGSGLYNIPQTGPVEYNQSGCTAPDQPIVTLSASSVCQGQSYTYSVQADPAVSSYSFVYTGSGATMTGSGNSRTITFSTTATSGNLEITASNTCGNSTIRTIPLTVGSIPSQPGAFTTSSSSVCAGKTGVVFTVGTSATISTYNFSYSGSGVTINGTGNSRTLDFASNATSGTLTVTGTNANGCTNPTGRVLFISVSPVNQWNGGTSSDWHTTSNWCGGIPTTNQDVLIPSGVPNYPVVSATATSRNITINNGASLTIGGATLTIKGTSNVNGTLVFNSASAKIVYNGASVYNGSWTDNASANVVYNSSVVFSKQVQSRTSITVNGQLTFPANGKIIMTNNAVLTLGQNASYTGASRTAFVEGKMAKLTASTSSFVFPLGVDTLYRKIGVIPQNATLTTFTAEYFKKSSKSVNNSNTTKDNSIYFISDIEHWVIDKPTGSPAKVIMYWGEGSKVNDNGDFSDLRLAHLNTTTNNWEMFNVDVYANSTPFSGYMVTKNYLTSFSPLSAAGISPSQTLPVQFKTFTVAQEDNKVELNWATATETNNSGFEIQRSYDGFQTFETLGFVDGNGSTNETSYYSYSDTKAKGTIIYYRLKQVDYNGKESFSEIKYIILSKPTVESIVYPNPTTGIVIVTAEDIESATQVEYSIIGADGMIRVSEVKVTGKDINDSLSSVISNLKNGAYTIVISTNKSRYSMKLIKI